MPTEPIRERLDAVHERIRAACGRSGRNPSSVRLVCVTKTVPAERIQAAIEAGAEDFGENRIQEAREKQPVLRGRIRWHLIGHLQRNKARDAVRLFDVIHSVDSLGLVEALAKRLDEWAAGGAQTSPVGGRLPPGNGRPALQALIQVNISGEAAKSGCRPDEAAAIAEAISRVPGMEWAGLMTIPPLTASAEQARPGFRELRLLRDSLAASTGRDPASLRLSMGMSNDFEVAIEEGADIVRVGSAIFGPRDAAPR